jgi:hypothetical protein
MQYSRQSVDRLGNYTVFIVDNSEPFGVGKICLETESIARTSDGSIHPDPSVFQHFIRPSAIGDLVIYNRGNDYQRGDRICPGISGPEYRRPRSIRTDLRSKRSIDGISNTSNSRYIGSELEPQLLRRLRNDDSESNSSAAVHYEYRVPTSGERNRSNLVWECDSGQGRTNDRERRGDGCVDQRKGDGVNVGDTTLRGEYSGDSSKNGHAQKRKAGVEEEGERVPFPVAASPITYFVKPQEIKVGEKGGYVGSHINHDAIAGRRRYLEVCWEQIKQEAKARNYGVLDISDRSAFERYKRDRFGDRPEESISQQEKEEVAQILLYLNTGSTYSGDYDDEWRRRTVGDEPLPTTGSG